MDESSPEGQYPALAVQRGMILGTLRQPAAGVDIQQVTMEWDAPLDREAFVTTWQAAIRRHPVLRTSFRVDGDDGLVQVVDPAAGLDIRWRELAPDDSEREPIKRRRRQANRRHNKPEMAGAVDRFIRTDRFEPFDVGHAPLLRVTVLSDGQPHLPGPVTVLSQGQPHPPGPVTHRVVLTFHHAILDGRSLRLLLEEVFAEYAARRAGQLPDHPYHRPFSEFVYWWAAVNLSAAETFWKGYLAEPAMPRSLPGYLGDRTGQQSDRTGQLDDRTGQLGDRTGQQALPASHEVVLNRSDSDRVRATAAAVGAGPSTVVNAAWALLRAGYGGTDDVTFAMTRSCRYGSVADADGIVGMLINTVPLRIQACTQWTVRQLLADVAGRMREVREHQLAPLTSILDWAGLAPDTPLLDSLVVFERQRLHSALARLGPEPARRSVRVHRLPSYPITLYAFDEPDMRLAAMWDGRRILDASARHMLAQLRNTVLEMAYRPDAYVSELNLSTPAETRLRAGWSGVRRPYRRDASVPELFAARVADDPDATALVVGDRTTSYAELDRETTQLAWTLHRRGVALDSPVAVALPRGAMLIAALLGVLKAGGAYLPVDLTSPPARIATMLADSKVRLVLTTLGTAALLPELGSIEVLDIAELVQQPAPPGRPSVRIHPLNLAYVSYTSGSTGVPKGVAVGHRAIVRLVENPNFATLGPGERLLQLAPVAFDASTLEIWGALLTGATIVVAPPDPVGLNELATLLRAGGITVAWLTAGLFHQLVDVDVAALSQIGQLLTGGDVVDPAAVRAALLARGGLPVVNGYGPTENTTFTTCHVISDPDQVGQRVPIGRPVPHTTVHVFDEDGHPVPIGIAGELHAGGDGLSRGYLGNAAATARSFVPDPNGSGERLYRTGDLARWRADGVLEFLGRIDDQVKIRGFRVEPGEVEAVLQTHPGISEVAVCVRGDGPDRHLIGYVTPADGTDRAALRTANLWEYASGRLPDYLVPAGFVVLDRLPLSANGKVDRAALPPYHRDAPDHDPALAGPDSPTEHRLADLWLRLLPGEHLRPVDIGRETSFFALGGNSLTTARLMFRVRETFGVQLSLGEFYRMPTLAATAAAIDSARRNATQADAADATLTDATPADTANATPTDGTLTDTTDGTLADAALTDAALTDAMSADAAPLIDPAAPAIGAAALPAIRRRDRASHRVGRDPVLPGHLVRLSGGWALWRTVCLRTAGFPVDLLAPLCDAEITAAADRTVAARAAGDAAEIERAEAEYAAEFPRAIRRLSHALHSVASYPPFREAVAWQNPQALITGIDALLRRDPEHAVRNTKHRQHEALVVSYLQRYCAKNDTIGFFGPVGWAQIDGGEGIRVGRADPPALLAGRTVYLEGWAVAAVMAAHSVHLRPWLVPRRMPFLDVSGTTLRVPLAPAVKLTGAEAAVLGACDGVREAHDVADVVLADPNAGLACAQDVYHVLDTLSTAHRLVWQLEVAPHDTRPEQTVRARLSRVTDETVRRPALAALDELCAARDALAEAAGDPPRLTGAMADLAATFTRLAGVPPTRRAGTMYAGRTLVYEECLRADTVHFGEQSLDDIREPLGLMLDSARWFTAAGAALYRRIFDEIYRGRAAELGTSVVPFIDFWLRVGDSLFHPPERLTALLVGALHRRWAKVLLLPADQRRVRLASAQLAPAVAAAFPPGRPGWPTAVQHSPDLMIAATDATTAGYEWVLGELHPGVNTMRYATWVAFHPSADALRAAMATDIGRRVVYLAETGQDGGVPTRQSNVFVGDGDIRLVFAPDSFGHDPRRSLLAGECDLVDSATGLRVRHRDGWIEFDLMEVLGDAIATGLLQHFRILAPAAHTPRVTIDSLVVSREAWTFSAMDLAFAGTADEARRFQQARAWVAERGLPRHIFLRCAGERKPVYADLTSLASIDLISRSARRARQYAGDGAPVTVVEMLPAPDQLWLTDAGDRRYAAELRVVAVDGRAD